MDLIFGLVMLAVAVFVYLLPLYVAYTKKHINTTAIGVLNVLLGWTLLGWVAALVWAVTKPSSAPQ